MSQQNQPVYIYLMIDPISGYVKYVGSTITLGVRYQSHLSSGANSKMISWIGKLDSIGHKPLMVPIEVASWTTRFAREQYWIRHFRKLRMPLVNIANASAILMVD